MVETKMRTLSKCEGIRESSEVYIVSSTNNENNTKIRDIKMDIKTLVATGDVANTRAQVNSGFDNAVNKGVTRGAGVRDRRRLPQG